ncbi:sulfatase-like hydrolase/transferase [Sphingosinicella rhizophila]|uniref:Sulfatase-like hydrolase/transferase n=1 Tax=Sphingosinicella rhizophila TaxID=3050082 RepID=A0ABU3Q6T2_9SPHN|nr:sulfatase-like hydrolase/transferase [Sphingosinicella sp. GR2756]MDT9599037.1 sulfatase-like hydrolase/transferase [Sphingosinicella sp. GR2756]
MGILTISTLERLKALWAPTVAFVATLAVELALVERKYAIFGGGFGASHVVDTAVEAGLFTAGLIVSQALLIVLFFLGIRAWHRKGADRPLFLFNFLFFTIGTIAALLAAKFEVLSYFSDAIGFKLIRNLGGGSLVEALLYVRDEAALVGVAAVGAGITYWLCRIVVKRSFTGQVPKGKLGWRQMLWLAAALVLISLAANRNPDVRYALTRFNSYALADIALQALTDFDRDGYSWFGARIDRHPFDAARHPLALDIPGNGIDEDGYGGDFSFAGKAAPVLAPKLPASPKNVVLIVLESTRGDAIGRRVGGREVTPVLNALGRQGTYVEEAYSHVGFTSPSLKSLFTGALAPAPGTPSLFRDLKRAGYRIGVYSGQSEDFGDISAVAGMAENAEPFVDAHVLEEHRAFEFASKSSIKIDGRILLREYDKSFGQASDWTRPVFLYFNFQEAHFPYHHPGMLQLLPGKPIPRSDVSKANKDWVAHTYWNAVAFNDWLIGQVVERLKKMGVWDNTLLVVTADHGESLFDDDFLGHGHVINRQQTQVPLIIAAPGAAVSAPVGLDDYRTMILRLLGAEGVAERPAGPVFQYIGDLDAPTEIGMVEKGGRWTTMRIDSETMWFSESGRRPRYEELRPGSTEKGRADRLIDEWARQRWLAELARR